MRVAQGSQKPRILLVGGFPPPGSKILGGIVTSCRVLMESSFSTRAEIVLVDSTQISKPPPGFAVRAMYSVKRFLNYMVRFERQRPEAVLLFTSAGASAVEKGAMAWYARIRGIPALIFPRGGALIDRSYRSNYSRLVVRLVFKGARVIMCQGPAWQRFAVEILGNDIEDAPIITNWTATPELLAIGRRRVCDGGERPVRLLFLGALDREKGIFELLEACRNMSRSRHFTLNVVGEGNASKEVSNIIARNQLESVVHISGCLDKSEVERALEESDVLVLPSWYEGLPNAMIEAMAARLAVIVTAVGNIPDFVTDGSDALLVAPRDVPALQSALEKVIDDPQLRIRLGSSAFSLAERKFGVEQAADRILAVVLDTIGRFGVGRGKPRETNYNRRM